MGDNPREFLLQNENKSDVHFFWNFFFHHFFLLKGKQKIKTSKLINNKKIEKERISCSSQICFLKALDMKSKLFLKSCEFYDSKCYKNEKNEALLFQQQKVPLPQKNSFLRKIFWLNENKRI